MRTPVSRVGGSSLASRARSAILSAIVEDRFEGGRIPPESELANILGVSRTTVRAALQVLEHDGVIARTPGRGTMVLQADPFALSLQRLIGFSTLLRESGTDAEVEVEWTETLDPPEEAVRRLGIDQDERCHVSRKIFRSGAVAALVLQDVVPQTSLKQSMTMDPTFSDSLFDFSEEYFVEPIDSARVELVPDVASGEIALLFEVQEGSPYMMLFETHMTRSNVLVAFTCIHVNDRFVRFYVTRRR